MSKNVIKRLDGPPVKVIPHVAESGRVWSIDYDDIQLIPKGKLNHGDVLVVTRRGHEGHMIMQAIQKSNGRFEFKDMARDLN